MLVPLNQLKLIYNQILSEALKTDGEGCSITIFVANDTDALSALKIVTVSLLVFDSI
jgi:hypothetical protein